MDAILIITTSISYFYILKSAGKSFRVHGTKTKHTKWMSGILWATHSLFFAIAQYYYIPSYTAFLILLILMFLTFYVRFDESALPLYFASIHYVFYIYTLRSIVLSIAAILLSSNILIITKEPLLNLLLFQLTLILAIFYFDFLKKRFLSIENVRILLRYPKQLSFVLIHKTILGVFMMMITYSVHFSNNYFWFNHFHLIASFLFTFLGTYTLRNGILITQTLDHKEHTELLEKQLAMQKQQYQAYQEYTDSFRKFKHDFNSMMSNVNSLLDLGKVGDAQKLLGQIAHRMESNVNTHQKYSNHQVLNVILQDFANQCRSQNIHFKAQVFWSSEIEIEELSLIRIFNNVLNNAFEANLYLNNDRSIKLGSRIHEHWLSIQIKNTFDGQIDEKLRSRKKNQDKHGMGTTIVKEEIENIGGFVNFNHDDKVFTCNLHFPLKG